MTKRKGTRHPRTAIYSLYGPNDRVASKAVVAIGIPWVGSNRLAERRYCFFKLALLSQLSAQFIVFMRLLISAAAEGAD